MSDGAILIICVTVFLLGVLATTVAALVITSPTCDRPHCGPDCIKGPPKHWIKEPTTKETTND